MTSVCEATCMCVCCSKNPFLFIHWACSILSYAVKCFILAKAWWDPLGMRHLPTRPHVELYMTAKGQSVWMCVWTVRAFVGVSGWTVQFVIWLYSNAFFFTGIRLISPTFYLKLFALFSSFFEKQIFFILFFLSKHFIAYLDITLYVWLSQQSLLQQNSKAWFHIPINRKECIFLTLKKQ